MNQVKVLLLEGINETAVNLYKTQNYYVETLPYSLNKDDLITKIKDVHIICIRSKTELNKDILIHAKKLRAIGCYCIGTDQVDLQFAEKSGIIVFNSPFANSRSVAELVMAEIIMLSRKIMENNNNIHKGIWNKTSKDCYEVRGKTLGIVGYGHVGTQVSYLAESFSMNVQYYDIEDKLPIGNAKSCETLDILLKTSDFVTLHVPKTDQTNKMIGERELQIMPKSSYLLNLSRGNVVDIDALHKYLKLGHISGCAIDVYPIEPRDNNSNFKTILQNNENTILTSHIGGSTIEAQESIAKEVTQKIIKYIKEGSSHNSVNFPQILPQTILQGRKRLLNIHYNKPGVLKSINNILQNYNISGQWLNTTTQIGYLIIDIDNQVSNDLLQQINKLESSIFTKLL